MDDSILKFANNLKQSQLKLQEAQRLDQMMPEGPNIEGTAELLT